MSEELHSATTSVNVDAIFNMKTDMTYVDGCRNVLGFALSELSKNPLRENQLEEIAKQAKKLAQELLQENVYEQPLSAYHPEREREGQLYQSIQIRHGNSSIDIYSDARDHGSGYPYAGSIEYGFHPGGGSTFVPPRPFLRPAIEYMINATRASFEDNVQSMMSALENNNLSLSHFFYRGHNSLGASRRTWGDNAYWNLSNKNIYDFHSNTSKGVASGKYSYSQNRSKYGVQKRAYKSVWDISLSKKNK